MSLAVLQRWEARKNFAAVESYLNSPHPPQREVTHFALTYYIRRGKPKDAVRYYATYLDHTKGLATAETAGFAMACAHRLGEHGLVAKFFTTLSASEQEKLPNEILFFAAYAFLKLGKPEEADAIAQLLRLRFGLPALPDFWGLLQQEFGGHDGIRTAIASGLGYLTGESTPNVRQVQRLALALMAENQFEQAIGVLEKCRQALLKG
ncbi:MAG: hypothetical protein NZL89_04420 [Leptospiraceae bacterium]|nr:hypothetical protein [Leptospiraceae bacterium]